MSLLKSVHLKGVRGIEGLPAVKAFNGLPRIPAHPQGGAVVSVPVVGSALREGGLMKQTVVAPSSLLQSMGVRRSGGKKLGF